MNDIDHKALEHACQCAGRSVHHFDRMAMRPDEANQAITFKALCRAIEQHEAFKREVSDAVEAVFAGYHDAPIPWVVMRPKLEPFIIAKPDPLVEVINDADDMVRKPDAPSYAEAIRAALAARGLEIREKQP